MGKYAPLGDFLRSRRTALVPMTFDEIEEVTGARLPPKAQFHRAWWSNNPSNNVMTRVWLEAGFETEQVDMSGRKLVFRRVREPSARKPAAPSSKNGRRARHPLFGALKGLVHVMPGTDLTQPADPEWADRVR
ncbi:MAG: hypothetical protein AB7V40_09270 [Methyloceanibacter sp.]